MKFTSKFRFIRFSLFILISFLGQFVSASTYYVSNTGSDNNNGLSIGSPFLSIQKAANVAISGDIVYVREGVYREEVKISKSGTLSQPITFKSYNEEKVIVTTTDMVNGWSTYKGNIYSTLLSGGFKGREEMTIFVNGEWIQEALWSDKAQKINMLNREEYADISSFTTTSISDPKLAQFPDDYWNGSIINVQRDDWSMVPRLVTDFISSSGTVVFEGALGFLNHELKYVLLNSINALDSEGEWYFDETQRKLYLWAPRSLNPNNEIVEVKSRDECFILDGVSHIVIDGMEMRGGDVSIINANHIILQNNYFNYPDWNFGPSSSRVYSSLIMNGTDNVVRDNEIEGYCSRFLDLQGANNLIVNNYFHDMGYNNIFGSAISLNQCDEGNLISHNTFERFAHSVITASGGFKFIIQNNEFSEACMLTGDVGAIGFANSSFNNSIIQYNVFHDLREMCTGIYVDCFGSDLVVHHNISYNNPTWGMKFNLPTSNIQCFNNTIYDNGEIDCWSPFEGATASEVRIYNNITKRINGRLLDAGAYAEGNFISVDGGLFKDAVNGDFRLNTSSGAIDCGIEINNITDNFQGVKPDAGALEFGDEMWKYGHDFIEKPDPLYEWFSLPYSSFIYNPSFENELDYWVTKNGTPSALYVNTWQYRTEALGKSGSRSLELNPGDQIEQKINDLQPNTVYKLTAESRILRKDIQVESYNSSSRKLDRISAYGETSLGNFNNGDWLRYDNIDFGSVNPLYNKVEIGIVMNAEINFKLVLDKLDGTNVIAQGSLKGSGVKWSMDGSDLPEITGTHTVYLVINSASNDAKIDRFRLLNTYSPEKITLGVKNFDEEQTVKTLEIGYSHWVGAEGIIFKTGADPKHATVFLEKNGGLMKGYVENVSLIKVEKPAMYIELHNIPGIIEAEDFDNGGQGIAYNMHGTKILKNSYRTPETVEINTTDDDSGNFHVNNLKNGEWLEYSISSIETGSYNVELRYSLIEGENLPVIYQNNKRLASFNASHLNEFGQWQTEIIEDLEILGGENQKIRIQMPEGSVKINYLKFIKTFHNSFSPISNFNISSNFLNLNEKILFQNTSENAESFVWDFGDGTTSSELEPSHNYASEGKYTITLTAKNSVGTARKSKAIVIEPGMRIDLMDNIKGNIMTGWTIVDEGLVGGPSNWSVINGALVQNSNINGLLGGDDKADGRLGTYAYWDSPEAIGWSNYQLNLNIKSDDDDGLGVMFYYKDPNNYYRFEIDRQRSMRKLIKKVNGEVTLLAHDNVSYVTGQVYPILISMENGEANVSVNGETFYKGNLHDPYIKGGSVAMYSWGNDGAHFSNIVVQIDDPTPDPTPDPEIIQATPAFSVKTSNIVTGETLSFNNTSANADTYVWNFGDGATSTVANPTHAYTKLGTYKVELTATSKAGTSKTSTNVVVSLLPVSAKFSVKTSDVVTGETLSFANTSANADSYVWNFGDGTTSTLANPTHAYSKLGTYNVELTATSKAGTSKTSANVVVSLLPVSAKFSVKTNDVVTGETLSFNNTSANADSYSWNFGDGTTSTLANPTHSYSKLGTYTVTLTATSKAGTSKSTANVAVTLQPVSANFSVKTADVVTGESLTFNNTSANATSYSWNFGDGTTSTASNPTHAYTKLGTYKVELTATSKAGTSKTSTNVVVSLLPVSAKFSVKTADVVTGETLSFNNTSANADSYSWNFGDGTTSTAANPTHAYTKLGTYKVELTATSKAGTSKVSANVNVTLLPVSAKFSVKTADVVTGESLTFNNTSANATSYSWNFGDGNTSTLANPTHVYTKLGIYKVELTATSKAGTSKVSANVNVTLLPVSAKFSVKTADVVTGETLTFNNTSSNATSYSWNFGDGTTSTAANPTHAYSALGTYKVELTASSKAGTSKVSANVNVTLLPVTAKFSVKTTDIVTGETLTFSNTSSNATSYSWNFGDGTTSTVANPTHAFKALGNYKVELTANGPAGTTKTSSTINVNMEPVKANFTMDKAEVFTKEEIYFNNTSSAADSYVWDFGDGNTSAQTSPRHSYANSGTYSVVLTAKGLAGKSAKINSVLVKEEVLIPDPDPTPDPIIPAVAGFSMDKTTDIVTGEELIFTNTSKDAAQYLWDFGDGNTSRLENPTHSYEKTGEYTVTMKASNEDTEATVSVTIEVNIEPVSTSFTLDKVEIYEGDSVRFSNTSLHASSYLWNFGDGETSTESNPTHTFTISGNYTVVLEASNKAGKMSHSETLSVIVKPAVAQFTVGSVVVFTNEVISFTNTSIHATEYAWNLGDGNTSALKNPVHTYTAAGVYTVTLIASNKGGQSPEFTQEIIVSDEPVVVDPVEPENAAPVANSESFVTPNNTPIAIVLSATDVEEDVMTYEIISIPNNGVLTGAAPKLVYTPNASYSGTDEFTFVANDGKVNSEMATILIDVDEPTPKPINVAPKAIDQNITTDYNSNIEVTLEANDLEGDTLTFTVVEAPQNGFLLGEAPKVTYVPNENFYGEDAFKFTASDADSISNLASINIVVNEPAPDPTPEPINIAPEASNQLLSTPFNVNLTIVLDATDPENDSLIYTTVSVPANGILMGTAPNLVYLPNINFAGEDQFTFMASDSSNNSNVATISITVEKEVEEPEEESALLGYWAFDEGTGNVAVDKSGNNYNGELINTQWKELGQVNGAVVFDGSAYVSLDEHIDAFTELNQGAISLWFKTDAEDAGRLVTASNSKDFSSDLVLNCKDGFINYAVREENAAKLVVRSQFNTYNDNEWHNVVININTSSNQMYIDGELSKVSYIVGTSSSSDFFATVTNLDVLRIGNGEDKNNGNEDFFNGIQDEVKIYNQPLTEEEVKEQYDFVIASLPENAAPVAIQQNVQVIENYALNITLEGTDFNEDELTYSIMEYPLNGELTGEAPNITYKPLEGYVGNDSFTFIVFDGEDESQEASINITVVDYELAESLSEGLIGHWALDEESGTISNDLSGNNNDGTTVNERWFKNGKVDGAISFNGKGYINLDAHINAVQDLSDGSINLWFKTTDANAGRLFTAADKSDKSSDVVLDVFGGRVNFTVRDNEKLNLRVSTQHDNLNDGKWHHISVNVNPEGNLVYLDGNLADVYYTEGTASTSIFFSEVSDLDVMRIGNGEDADHGNEDYFNGSLDDVRLYSRGLEEAEVKSLFGRATDDNRKNPYLKETNLADISTWPNPAVNYVNIEFPDAGNFRVAIYDIKGKLMYLTDVVDNKTHAVGIGQYEIGMYFIKVTDLETEITFTQNILKREF